MGGFTQQEDNHLGGTLRYDASGPYFDVDHPNREYQARLW
jgi:hypothetical protein